MKKIKKEDEELENIPNDEPDIHADGTPIFKVKARKSFSIAFAHLPDKKARGCYLSFICPRCGQRNNHGGIYMKKGAGDGHRSSHCRCWPKGYYIVEI